MTINKKMYVENRPDWKVEYGTLIKNLTSISAKIQLINKFKSLEEKPLRIVDYGSAFGYVLRVLQILDRKHDLYGVEIAKEAVDIANHALKVGGKVFWQSCGSKFDIEDNTVDVITAFDITEHAGVPSQRLIIRQPHEAIKLFAINLTGI